MKFSLNSLNRRVKSFKLILGFSTLHLHIFRFNLYFHQINFFRFFVYSVQLHFLSHRHSNISIGIMLSANKRFPIYLFLIHTGYERILRLVYCVAIQSVHTPRASRMKVLEIIADNRSSCVVMRMNARK